MTKILSGYNVYNVFIVLKNANKKDAIMFYKNDMYKVS